MTRRMLRIAVAVVVAGGAACAPDAPQELARQDEGAALAGVRNDALRAAADGAQLPRQLLVAHAWVLSRLEAPATVPEPLDVAAEHAHVHEPLFGLMQLEEAAVEKAAALTGLSADSIRTNVHANTEAAAALLAEFAREEAQAGVGVWEALSNGAARLSGFTHPTVRDLYIADLFRVLGRGLDVTLWDGERVAFAPVVGLPAAPEDARASVESRLTAPGEYPAMKWLGAHPNNFAAGRKGGGIKYVIIHMTAGSYLSALKWFAMDNRVNASTQYVIRSEDGEITQMVNETDGSWHAGNQHYSLNSIGIEHEGNMPDPSIWYTEAMYQSSARLVCALAKRYDIPIDRQHIIGHYQVPDYEKQEASNPPGTDEEIAANPQLWGGISNKGDPSYDKGYWNWEYYMQLLRDCVAAAKTPEPLPRGYVHTAAPTEFYSGPGASGPLQGTLAANVKLFVERGPLNDEWYQVLEPDGVRVFVRGETLKQVQAELVHRLPTTEKVAGLTFDVGADSGHVAVALDTLATHQVKATFAVTGAWVDAHPKLALRIHAEGHQLVSQGYVGQSFTGISTSTAPLSYEERTEDLWKAHVSLTRVVGVDTKPFFFAPAGDTDPTLLSDAFSRGYDFVLRWYCDSVGARGVAPADIVQRALNYASAGVIYRFDLRTESQDAAALDELLRSLIAQDFRLVRVSEYLPPPTVPPDPAHREDSVVATASGE